MFDGIEKPLVLAATSDIHGYLEGIQEVCFSRNVEILVIAGDIEPADLFTSKPYWFERKFFKLIEKLDCEVVAIPGNHDFYLAGKYEAIKRGEYSHAPKNFHLLVDEEVTIKGIRFYGSPWVPYIDGRWCFEAEDADLADRFMQIPVKVDVLITHTPPFMKYREIDMSLDNPPAYRRHFGSTTLAEALDARAPRMVLCGHIHSGDHRCAIMHTSLENSMVHIWNVSRVNEDYNIAYKIKLLELNPGAIREMSFNEPFPTGKEKVVG